MEKKEISERAEPFIETRNNRLFEKAEDYAELVDDLIQRQGNARICDISREMGVSHVSVLKALKRLIRDGFLEKTKEKNIVLTTKGHELAAFSKKKHRILTQFLLQLGIPENIVANDVEGIEHYISATTLEAIENHLKKM